MFINVGYGNLVCTEKITAVTSPSPLPIKRSIKGADDRGTLVDATNNRKTLSVLFTDEYIIVTAISPDAMRRRLNGGDF